VVAAATVAAVVVTAVAAAVAAVVVVTAVAVAATKTVKAGACTCCRQNKEPLGSFFYGCSIAATTAKGTCLFTRTMRKIAAAGFSRLQVCGDPSVSRIGRY
jgi:hypothetical protein